MKKILLFLLLLSISGALWGQTDLLVKTINQKPYLEHTIVNNQSIFVLSKTYHLSLAEIADNNNELYKRGFKNGDVVKIPVNTLNYLSKPDEASKPLYYVVENNENLSIISKRLHIIPSMIQTWNDLPTPYIKDGQKIIIGWVKYSEITSFRPSQSQGNIWQNKELIDEAIATEPEAPQSITTSIKDQYEAINIDEQQVNGLAVFYNNKTTKDQDVYFAFHNTIPKGNIVKITNPINPNNYIFATILGKIPPLQEYNNALVVLSDNAIKSLKAESKDFFCNLFYK